MPDCLVTGASGFIGTHLVRRLCSEGFAVRCLVRPRSDISGLDAHDCEFYLGDLARPDPLDAAVDGCALVYHCGAMVSDWATVAEIRAVNVHGTHRLLEAARRKHVRRFVHLSTTDVYGHPGTPGVTEDSPYLEPHRNWYARTKAEAEQEVRAYHVEHGVPAVVVRPATVYGPGSRHVVGEIGKAIAQHTMLLINGGRAHAGLCYIDNLIDAVIRASREDAALGHAFNITDECAVTWKGFLSDIARGLGLEPRFIRLPYFIAAAMAFGMEESYRMLRRVTGVRTRPLLSRQAVQVMGIAQDFSADKARRLLSYRPRIDYETAMARTTAWLRDYLQSTDGAAGVRGSDPRHRPPAAEGSSPHS